MSTNPPLTLKPTLPAPMNRESGESDSRARSALTVALPITASMPVSTWKVKARPPVIRPRRSRVMWPLAPTNAFL